MNLTVEEIQILIASLVRPSIHDFMGNGAETAMQACDKAYATYSKELTSLNGLLAVRILEKECDAIALKYHRNQPQL